MPRSAGRSAHAKVAGFDLATASQDDEIRIWGLDSGACLQVLRPDLPYAGTNILGAEGLSDPEATMLRALGAVVRYGDGSGNSGVGESREGS